MAVRRIVDLPSRGIELEVLVDGTAVDVVLLPSALRSASDFDDLSARLVRAGWGTAALNLRGVGASTTADRELTIRDVAADVAAIVDALASGPVHVVGHALGNTFARAVAAYHPAVVSSVVLLACGGHDLSRSAPGPDVLEHFARCHDPQASKEARMESLSRVFFAPGNDPSAWLDGWWPGGAGLSAALHRGDPGEWAEAGSAPVLIVQPVDDVLGPLAVGLELAGRIGPRARYVEIDHCGHAILPEQPDRVAALVVSFLREHGPPR